MQVHMNWNISAFYHTACGRGSSLWSAFSSWILPAREKQGYDWSALKCQTECLPPETSYSLWSVSTWLQHVMSFAEWWSAPKPKVLFQTHQPDKQRSWLEFLHCSWSQRSQWEHAHLSLLPVGIKAQKKQVFPSCFEVMMTLYVTDRPFWKFLCAIKIPLWPFSSFWH